MASNLIQYDDGFEAGASAQADRFKVPVQDGPKRVTYPFKNAPVPDALCVKTERDFVVRKAYDVELINATTLNGGFETAGGGGADVFDNWTESVPSGTLTRDTTTSHSGSACAKFVPAGASDTAQLTQYVLTTGKTYKITAWAKSSRASAFAYISFSNVFGSGALTTSWAKYIFWVTSRYASFQPSSSALTLNIASTTIGGAISVWVDDVVVTELDSVEAFDESAIMGVSKSFTNKFLYSSDLTNAAWTKAASGTGSVPVATAGFTGPDGAIDACRIQMDHGAGTGVSQLYQTVSALANPHSQASSFWYKSNTGQAQLFMTRYLDGASVILKVLTATNKWKQFWITNSVSDATSYLTVEISNGYGVNQQVDIIVGAPQLDVATYIGPFISTTSAEVTRSLPYVDGVSTPKAYDNNYKFLDYDQDSLAFIVNESDPVPTGIGNLLRFTRRFSRIPANQVIPSSKYFNRPVLHNIKSGANYAVSFGDQTSSHVFTSRKSITSSYYQDESTSTAALPSGTVTATDLSSDTATWAANASAATIEAALATLTNATGYIDATAASNSVTGYAGCQLASLALPANVQLSYLNTLPGFQFAYYSTGSVTTPASTTFVSTAHGGIVGDRVALWKGDSLIGMATVTGASTDAFTVSPDEVGGTTIPADYCAFSSDAAFCVVNGPKMVSLRNTQRYYLPGYTTGITTAADITPPATATDPIAWLAAIVASTAWVVDSVTDLKSWDGPILVQESSEIQMSDAVDTVTP